MVYLQLMLVKVDMEARARKRLKHDHEAAANKFAPVLSVRAELPHKRLAARGARNANLEANLQGIQVYSARQAWVLLPWIRVTTSALSVLATVSISLTTSVRVTGIG